jgi:hypothetical protein
MATLAEIRAKLQANENRGKGGNQSKDNTVYPQWNIPEGTTARIRFLPDGNTKNDFFWVTREVIKLPFAGIKGQADSKPVIVQVPCVEMYDKTMACPILAEVRTWFKTKDPAMEELGRKYWKKKSYLFQGFVRDNPLADDKTPENPIRRFVMTSQIYNLIETGVKDPDMENLPTDYQGGLDFNVKKTSKGGYADYSTSGFARKESALTADELEAIEKYGLYNLADFLPKKPGDVELQIIKEMFEASVNGEAYDPDRWANYYKPAGLQTGSGNNGDDNESTPTPVAQRPVLSSVPKASTPPSTVESAPWEDEDEGTSTASAPVAPAAPKAASSDKAAEILAMIRNRPTK